MSTRESILRLIPDASGNIPWEAWETTALGAYIEQMCRTPQEPKWHGEGDVWTHTRMVCEALVADEEYQAMTRRSREILFLAAVMHDIGKPKCTICEDGVIRSPRHAAAGAKIARHLLWETWGMCGTAEWQSFREAVCMLIRYHGMPLYIGEREDPERTLIEMASCGTLIPDFSLEMLRVLARADMRGRIAADISERLEDIALAFLPAEEMEIMRHPYPFPDEVTRHAYLEGAQVARDYGIYDETWREVIIVAGLQGTGKDTWIRTHYPDLPMISLDEIRREMKISPADRRAQALVATEAKERAKVLLRERKSFVWNATNISPDIRRMLMPLFEKYGAYTHLVYLETTLEEALARNRGREAVVPDEVIRMYLSKLEPPLVGEAHLVEWILT